MLCVLDFLCDAPPLPLLPAEKVGPRREEVERSKQTERINFIEKRRIRDDMRPHYN